jgi:hypothetical protein
MSERGLWSSPVGHGFVRRVWRVVSTREWMPVLGAHELLRTGKVADAPTSLPFAPFLEREARCDRNHGQSAELLASRGGLSFAEALLILLDMGFRSPGGASTILDEPAALPLVLERLAGLGWSYSRGAWSRAT